MESNKKDFILYTCAGCSKAGQAAYKIAIQLNETDVAEMSCLAGIASGKPSFRKELADKKIASIDGCPLECSKTVLQNQGMQIDEYFQLRNYGIRKHEGATDQQIEAIALQIAEALNHSTR